MIVVLALHLVIGFFVLAAARVLGRWVLGLVALPSLAAIGFALAVRTDVLAGELWSDGFTWVPGLDLRFDLLVDPLALLMILVVSGMGLAVLWYSRWYFGTTAAAARTAGLLVLFAGAMLGLVTAEHVLVLYLSWELTSILSWLLIGQKHTDPAARAAATHALVVTGAGGLALLGGLVILAREAGTWSLTALLDSPPTGGVTTAGLVLVVAGIVTKSAQYPFHAWLPGAMVAPTPVSAYLHSATMVKAGIYLALRFAPAFAAVGWWRPAVIGFGLVTMIAGGLRAVRQHDLKLLLAMGTVSQLGFLLVLTGAGFEDATIAGVTLLIAHALFKGTLFLIVGIVDHQAHTRDRRELAARFLGRGWTAIRVCAVVTAASMAGVPPLLGFIAKEEAYDAFLHEGGTLGTVGIVGIVAGSILTMAYSLRFAAVFWRRPSAAAERVLAPSSAFAAPVYVLTALTVVGGLWPTTVFGSFVDGAAGTVLDHEVHAHLALWHGLNLALALSAATIAAGVSLWWVNEAFVRMTGRVAPPVDGAAVFTRFMDGLYLVARLTTGRIQTGSMPRYVGVILLTVVGGPTLLLLATVSLPSMANPIDAPGHGVLAIGIVAAAIGAAMIRRRLGAVVILGAVGYGMAGLFVIQGAPDLALTQFAIETLSIVAFVLVLRQLPDRYAPIARRRTVVARIALSTAVGAGIFVLALAVSGDQPQRTASDMAIEAAEPDAGGTNVVNVVLVDFRGLDTLGEITVLLVAAVGVTTLARIGRRPRTRRPPEETLLRSRETEEDLVS